MKIKNRLSLQFTIAFAIILATVFSVLYWISAQNRKQGFYDRLKDRALTNAEIFLAEDNLTKEKFREVQRKYPQQLPGEIVRIYDKKNNPDFISDPHMRWSPQVLAEVRAKGHIQYQQEGRQMVGIYYHDNSGDFVIMAEATDIYGYRQLRQLYWILISIFFITLIIVFFIGRIFAQSALAPIAKLIRQMAAIRASRLDSRVDEGNGKDEISELAVHFNNLLERLQQSFDMQQSFIANASHELRTPVTAIIGEIEVTLNKERTQGEYLHSLQSILAEAERLKGITNNLLELAQANFDISNVPMSDIRTDELLWDLQEEWNNRPGGRILEIQFNEPPADENMLVVHGNRPLLTIAVGNILLNAFKFSGFAKVTCSMQRKGKQIQVSITDHGVGIEKKDIPHIFQSFYRSGNAREFPGHGIGLSFAEKIIHLHGGEISVHSVPHEQTCFTVSLPARY